MKTLSLHSLPKWMLIYYNSVTILMFTMFQKHCVLTRGVYVYVCDMGMPLMDNGYQEGGSAERKSESSKWECTESSESQLLSEKLFHCILHSIVFQKWGESRKHLLFFTLFSLLSSLWLTDWPARYHRLKWMRSQTGERLTLTVSQRVRWTD